MRWLCLAPEWRRWIIVATFAIAFAWVEAAIVLYLRVLTDRLDPYQPDPLPLVGGLLRVERLQAVALSGGLWWAVVVAGVLLALYVFMTDTLHAVLKDAAAVTRVVPEQFNWPLFTVALMLMSMPVVRLIWVLRRTVTSGRIGQPPEVPESG